MSSKIQDKLTRVSPAGIESYFKQYFSLFKNKRAIELLAGCVLSRTMQQRDGVLHEILIPIKKRTTEPPTLNEIIANPALHLDSDVDLYLKDNGKSAFKVQITELEEHFSGKDIDEGLINLIRRKSKRSPDPDMILAILSDVDGVINCEKFRDGLKEFKCPFGSIFLLGQFGKNIELGQFTCRMLYPDFREPMEVQLDF